MATIDHKGRIVSRSRHGLAPGTKLEFIDEGSFIHPTGRRRDPPSDTAAGYGVVKIEPSPRDPRSLADFDPVQLLNRKKPASR